LRTVTGVVFGCIALVLAACGSSQTSGTDVAGCHAYAPSAGLDLTTPRTSLRRDVHPILVASCGELSCHGSDQTVQNQGLYVGPDPSAFRLTALKTSRELPDMPFVAPGDPSKSFLMHKIDGDACTFDAQCILGTCGDSMPQRRPLMSVADRDIVRRWITQDATDD
jgi:hypothetical protein